MSKKIKYPLEQVRIVKEKRLEAAELLLRKKKEILDEEEKTLEGLIKNRDEVFALKNRKIFEFFQKAQEGISSEEIERHDKHLKEVVEVQVQKAEEKVELQKQVVEKAQKEVDEAREDLKKKQTEVEKIQLHYEEWEKEMRKELAREEEKKHGRIRL